MNLEYYFPQRFELKTTDPYQIAQEIVESFKYYVYVDSTIDEHLDMNTADCRMLLYILASYLVSEAIPFKIVLRTHQKGLTHPKILLEDMTYIHFVSSNDPKYPLKAHKSDISESELNSYSILSPCGDISLCAEVIDSLVQIRKLCDYLVKSLGKLSLDQKIEVKQEAFQLAQRIKCINTQFANSKFVDDLLIVLDSF